MWTIVARLHDTYIPETNIIRNKVYFALTAKVIPERNISHD